MLNIKTSLLLLPFTLIIGCGGDGSDGSQNTSEDESNTSRLSLAISDAPVDALSQVIVCFNQVELKNNANDVTLTVGSELGMLTANDLCQDSEGAVIENTVGIDLLQYTGSDSIRLVDGVTIAAGRYSQMRLILSEGSYGIDAQSEEKIAISVPSNELKLDGFTATIGGDVNFTLEFDLNKAMTNPVGKAGYFLKPRGVRLVNNKEAGHIKGLVSESLLINNDCIPLADSSVSIASVYLYEGSDLNSETLSDNGGSEENIPLASSAVNYESSETQYTFEIGFLNVGDYTLALSCDKQDEPEEDDKIEFIETQNVSLLEGEKTESVVFDAAPVSNTVNQTLLKEVRWLLESFSHADESGDITNYDLLPDVSPTVYFKDNDTFMAYLDCNETNTNYVSSETALEISIEQRSSTEMFCGLNRQEAYRLQTERLFSILADIESYQVNEDTLVIKSRKGEVISFTNKTP